MAKEVSGNEENEGGLDLSNEIRDLDDASWKMEFQKAFRLFRRTFDVKEANFDFNQYVDLDCQVVRRMTTLIVDRTGVDLGESLRAVGVDLEKSDIVMHLMEGRRTKLPYRRYKDLESILSEFAEGRKIPQKFFYIDGTTISHDLDLLESCGKPQREIWEKVASRINFLTAGSHAYGLRTIKSLDRLWPERIIAVLVNEVNKAVDKVLGARETADVSEELPYELKLEDLIADRPFDSEDKKNSRYSNTPVYAVIDRLGDTPVDLNSLLDEGVVYPGSIQYRFCLLDLPDDVEYLNAPVGGRNAYLDKIAFPFLLQNPVLFEFFRLFPVPHWKRVLRVLYGCCHYYQQKFSQNFTFNNFLKIFNVYIQHISHNTSDLKKSFISVAVLEDFLRMLRSSKSEIGVEPDPSVGRIYDRLTYDLGNDDGGLMFGEKQPSADTVASGSGPKMSAGGFLGDGLHGLRRKGKNKLSGG